MVARMADQPPKTTTSLRIEPSLLRDLKVAAIEADTTANRLIIDGIRHVLALHRKRMARKQARQVADATRASRTNLSTDHGRGAAGARTSPSCA